MTQTLIQRRCVMKSYDELKAEMETIQQKMAEAKKNERTNALKEVKPNSLQRRFTSLSAFVRSFFLASIICC